MEIGQTIDKAINDYYAEQGKPVPKWKQKEIQTGGLNISFA